MVGVTWTEDRKIPELTKKPSLHTYMPAKMQFTRRRMTFKSVARRSVMT